MASTSGAYCSCCGYSLNDGEVFYAPWDWPERRQIVVCKECMHYITCSGATCVKEYLDMITDKAMLKKINGWELFDEPDQVN